MSYQYSKEAKERISRLGQSEIIDFIWEISPGLRRKAFGFLPKVAGFRVGHPTEIKEKQKRMLGYMFQTHSSPEERNAWKSFSLFWRFWAEEKIGKPFNICEDLDSEEKVGSIFVKEIAKTFPKVARENVERLFIFSRFADNPDVIKDFDLFPPAVVLARDNVVDALPVRLDELEQRIKSNDKDLEERDKEIKTLQSKIDVIFEGLKKSSNNERRTLNLINEVQLLINKETKKSDTIKASVDELYVYNENNKSLITSIQHKLDFDPLVINEISKHEELLNGMAVEISALKQSLNTLCDTQYSGGDNDTRYEMLSERLELLEERMFQVGARDSSSRCENFHEIRKLDIYDHLSSHEDVFDIISSNLQAVGLTKNSADTVARLALATFISGQIIQFSGSLADVVADAIANAIGAPSYHIWRVPVGIISDTDSFSFVESMAESSRCLVLKGANLSAFEIYGTAIRDIVVQRQIYPTKYDHLALIATLKQGPATFPDGGMLAELGPVIDTDILKMRGLSTILPKIKYGCLAKTKWADVEGLQVEDVSEYIEELRELLGETGFHGGSLWKRMIHIFYASLVKIPNGNYMYDLYSVLFFYTLTWAKIKNGPVKTIEDIATRELKKHSENMTA